MSDQPPQSPSGWPPPGGEGFPPPPPQGGGYPPAPPPPPPPQYGGGGGYPPPPPPGYGGPVGPGGPAGYGAPAPGPGSQWGTLADWPQRALGYLIDYAMIVAGVVVVIILGAILGAVSSALATLVFVLGYLAIIGFAVWLSIQVGQTGASPGMRVVGLRCIGAQTGQPIGGGMGFVRTLAHFVDSLICYIGWLFPLWDAQRQTIADKLLGTVVVTAPKQPFSITPPVGAV